MTMPSDKGRRLIRRVFLLVRWTGIAIATALAAGVLVSAVQGSLANAVAYGIAVVIVAAIDLSLEVDVRFKDGTTWSSKDEVMTWRRNGGRP